MKIFRLIAVFSLVCLTPVDGAVVNKPDRPKKFHSVPVITRYQAKKIVSPLAKVDPKLDPRLAHAATIAEERANAKSHKRCWQYVKEALLSARAVQYYPKTAYAKEAGEELMRRFGFKKMAIRDPYKAPVGSILVFGKRNNAGHVEIRTRYGFVSDFWHPGKYTGAPLLAVVVLYR